MRVSIQTICLLKGLGDPEARRLYTYWVGTSVQFWSFGGQLSVWMSRPR